MRTTGFSCRFAAVAALAMLAGSVLSTDALASTGPARAATACSTPWGSSVKRTTRVEPGPPMYNVRAATHPCFDRMVIDVKGVVRGYNAQYVSRVTGLASGNVVALRGTAFISIVFGATDHDLQGHLTYPRVGGRELVKVTGWPTFRQIAWAESQEGLTQIGLGVRARLPFRVIVLSGPTAGYTRVVIDVAHRW